MYQTEGMPILHRGNPLIEALPAPVTDRIALAKRLSRGPTMDLQVLMQDPPDLRVHNLAALNNLFIAKPKCLAIALAVDFALREFYAGKNPVTAAGQGYRYAITSDETEADMPLDTGNVGCIFVLGDSGIGKSTTIRTVLQHYPQVIRHTAYMEVALPVTQVVWLSVEAPTGGSTVTLQRSILEALDRALGLTGTKHAKTPKSAKSIERDDLTKLVEQALRTHAVGMIHIDDVQAFCGSTAGKRALRRFLVRLTNVLRVPILLSGTPEALEFFGGTFEVARRACNLGGFALERPAGPTDPVFMAVVKFLLNFQLVEVPMTVDTDTYEELYALSKGVTSVMKTLHIDAQKIALRAAMGAPARLMLKHYRDAHKLQLVLHGQLDELDGGASQAAPRVTKSRSNGGK